MEWLKAFLPLIEAGVKLYLSEKIVEKTAHRAKEVAIRSGILIFGGASFLIFFLAAILMVFIDMGNQFETHNGVHFSGMMLSGLYLFSLGLVIFGITYFITKAMEKKAREAIPVAPINPYAPLILFGEEFLKALIRNLEAKPHSPK